MFKKKKVINKGIKHSISLAFPSDLSVGRSQTHKRHTRMHAHKQGEREREREREREMGENILYVIAHTLVKTYTVGLVGCQ